jgi:hypothetical protein
MLMGSRRYQGCNGLYARDAAYGHGRFCVRLRIRERIHGQVRPPRYPRVQRGHRGIYFRAVEARLRVYVRSRVGSAADRALMCYAAACK